MYTTTATVSPMPSSTPAMVGMSRWTDVASAVKAKTPRDGSDHQRPLLAGDERHGDARREHESHPSRGPTRGKRGHRKRSTEPEQADDGAGPGVSAEPEGTDTALAAVVGERPPGYVAGAVHLRRISRAP